MKKIQRWLKTNNYELIILNNGDQAFYINPADRQRVFRYLENIDRMKDWNYRANYTKILVILKESK